MAKKVKRTALDSKADELANEKPDAVKYLNWPLPHGGALHESTPQQRLSAAKVYNERARILESFSEIFRHAATDYDAALAMAEVAPTWPSNVAGRRYEGAPAPLFDLELPSGVRLGDASTDELNAAILAYAEQGDNRARLMRDLLKAAGRFERVGY